VAVRPIPSKAAYLLTLSSTVVSRETADVPPETKTLARKAIQLVESELVGGIDGGPSTKWRRTITEYWLVSEATRPVREAKARHEAIRKSDSANRGLAGMGNSGKGSDPGKNRSRVDASKVIEVGTLESLRSWPLHDLAALARVHMLEVRYAPIEIGFGVPAIVISDLLNVAPGLEGLDPEGATMPFAADMVYGASLLPALADAVEVGKTSKGKMGVSVGAGTFVLEHSAKVAESSDGVPTVEVKIQGPATSESHNFITLTFNGSGAIRVRLGPDLLPETVKGQLVLGLHGKRNAPGEPEQEAEVLAQTIDYTLERVPISWDEFVMSTAAWQA